jgi:hypothetical protein
MLTVNCSQCHKDYQVALKAVKWIKYSPQFCSLSCLSRYIMSKHGGDVDWGVSGRILPRRPFVDGPDDIYSPLLHQRLRSEYERFVMEYFNEYMFLCYEQFVVMLGPDYGDYYPDFYFPAHGIWLEVKGEWRIGDKAKFESACKILGKDRLLLVGPQYYHMFKRACK